MIIETKRNIGDTVYILKDNKVVEVKVQEIDIKVVSKDIIIKYLVFDNGYKYTYRETNTFKTKQELLEAL